jgi:hypothetical protein
MVGVFLKNAVNIQKELKNKSVLLPANKKIRNLGWRSYGG